MLEKFNKDGGDGFMKKGSSVKILIALVVCSFLVLGYQNCSKDIVKNNTKIIIKKF